MMGTDVCRVSVHVDGGQADIALPADIAVGQLIPSLHEVLVACGVRPAPCVTQAPPIFLHRPGLPPLDPAKTLSENGIGDGSLLLLASTTPEPSTARVLSITDAVESIAQPRQRAPEQEQLTALLIAVAMAAVIGFVAVPGGTGAPSLLLGAAAAAGTAAIAGRVSRYGRTALLALSTLCTLVTATALGANLFGIPGPDAGLALTILSVGVLTLPGRLPVMLSGLSPHIEADLDPECDGVTRQGWAKARRAKDLLTVQVVGASCAATLGVAAATLLRPDRPGLAAAGSVAVVLVLQRRRHTELIRQTFLTGCGCACIAVLFISLRWSEPALALWICVVAAALAAGAIWLGFVPPAGSVALDRCLTVLECAALVCLLPLAGWSFGVFGAVRGLAL